jgi:hypothetical protein
LKYGKHYDGPPVLPATIDHGPLITESRFIDGIEFAGQVQRTCDCRTVIARNKRDKIIPIAIVNYPANYERNGDIVTVSCPKCKKVWGRLIKLKISK